MPYRECLLSLADTVASNSLTLDQAQKELVKAIGPTDHQPVTDLDVEVNSLIPKNSHLAWILAELNSRCAELLGDKLSLAHSLNTLGKAAYAFSKVERAIECHSRSLGIAKQEHNRQLEASNLGNLGNIYFHRGDTESAYDNYQKVRMIAREIGDKPLEGHVCGEIGKVLFRRGRMQRAGLYYMRAIVIARQRPDRWFEGPPWANLGRVYQTLGQVDKAERSLRKALAIAVQTDHRKEEGLWWGYLGAVQADLGQLGCAHESFRTALMIAREVDDIQGQVIQLGNIAETFAKSRDFVEANQLLDVAASLLGHEFPDKQVEMSLVGNRGAYYTMMGRPDEAWRHLVRALRIAEELEDRIAEGAWLGLLGDCSSSLKNYDEAEKYLQQAKLKARRCDDRWGEASHLCRLSTICLARGDWDGAIQQAEEGVKVTEKTGDLFGRYHLHASTGFAWEGKIDRVRALAHYQEALRLFERIWSQSRFPKEHLVEDVLVVFDRVLALCYSLPRLEDFFYYSESSRSRSLVDQMSLHSLQPTVDCSPELAQLLEKEARLLGPLQALHNRWTSSVGLPSVDLPQVPLGTHAELDRIYERLAEIDPTYVRRRTGRVLTVQEAMRFLGRQSEPTVLVEYTCTEEAIFTLVLDAGRPEIIVKRLEMAGSGRKGFPSLIDSFRRELTSCNGAPEGPSCRELSQFLLDPIQEFMVNNKRVIFVPHGPIHKLPLHALSLAGQPLVETHDVVYAPSLTIMERCLATAPKSHIQSHALIGIEFTDEIGELQERFETRALINPCLTEEKALQDFKEQVVNHMQGKDLIHFSCHGFFDASNGLNSGLVLSARKTISPEHPPQYFEVLTAREILSLKLSAELVVLSACETGLAEVRAGDELYGLSRAFLYAGAKAVLVSLWLVDAHASLRTTQLFYSNWQACVNARTVPQIGEDPEPADKARALRWAQLALREGKTSASAHNRDLGHPYYWAPFILIGDWR